MGGGGKEEEEDGIHHGSVSNKVINEINKVCFIKILLKACPCKCVRLFTRVSESYLHACLNKAYLGGVVFVFPLERNIEIALHPERRFRIGVVHGAIPWCVCVCVCVCVCFGV